MLNNLPNYISLLFGAITILTVFIFYKAAKHSKPVMIILLLWLALQAFAGLSGFYTVTDTVPPRFMLLILPPLILIIGLFTTHKGRSFIDSLDVKTLTILHIIRIPVELVLLGLFIHKAIPQLMTFEGRNFDILSGLSSPVVYYFAFVKHKLGRNALLAWNFICLGLLVNIVLNAILSAPFPFQQFAFDQPNIGLLYFPFVWLPCCVVPLVLFSHLASIRRLYKGNYR